MGPKPFTAFKDRRCDQNNNNNKKPLFFIIKRVCISDWLLQFPLSRHHFGANGPTSKSTEQCTPVDCRQKHCEHVTLLLKSHHWLPMKQRIEYKLATFAFAFRYFATSTAHFPSTSRTFSPRTLLQIPSIFFWQTTICPTCKLELCRCWVFPVSGAFCSELSSGSNAHVSLSRILHV